MTDRSIITANPLLIPVISLMAGIIYGRYGHTFPANHSLLLLTFCAILVAGIFAALKGWRLPVLILTSLLFSITGFVHIQKIGDPADPAHIYNLVEKPAEITLVGTIRTLSIDKHEHGRILVSVQEIATNEGKTANAHGLILLRTNFVPPPLFAPCTTILTRADVGRIRENGTPGTFDYRRYMRDKNIFVSGTIRSAAAMNIVRNVKPAGSLFNRAALFFQKSRHSVIRFIANTDLDYPVKGLYAAILTGDRQAIPENVLENFRKVGAFHLLAISGMHMFLLFLLSTILFNRLLKCSSRIMLRFPVWKVSAALSLLPLAYYTAISGANPPTVRAFIMATALIIAIILDRQNSIFNTLCLAALIILAFDPTALFSPSFQLSFTAVAGIILYNNVFPLLPEQQGEEMDTSARVRIWVRSSLIISLIALVVTAPLSLYYFQQTSFIGPVSTLITAPPICFLSLPIGLIASMIHTIFPAGATFLLKIGAYPLSFAERVTALPADFPFVWMKHAPPTILQIVCYYLFLLSFLTISRTRKAWFLPITFLSLAVFAPAITSSFTNAANATNISFIDVGQGSATLVELPGTNILVDGGSIRGGDFDIGEKVLAPYLWHRQIRKLDAIIITHAHSDHYNGLQSVISFFKPKTIWVNGSTGNDPEYVRTLSVAREYGAVITVPKHGEYLIENEFNSVRCLKNLNLLQDKNAPENSRSLVLEIKSHGRAIILPGDLMQGDGGKVFTGHEKRKVDVLLAPHHGSRSSATAELVSLLTPKQLIVSSGSSAGKNRLIQDTAFNRIQENTKLHMIHETGTVTCTISSTDFVLNDYRE